MKTYLECIPCFFNQAIEAGKITGASRKTQKLIVNEVAKALTKFPLSSTPPEMGRIVYSIVRKISKNKDPYAKLKIKSNILALKIYKQLKNRVMHSKDRLLTAIELAIAGNIIDYGVKGTLDLEKELSLILNEENKTIKKESKKYFNISSFKKALKKAKNILYVGDNAGEIVFDRVLIEEIKKIYPDKEIIYAVRGNPIINDVLFKDAVMCKIDKYARIISTGLDAPGVILHLCSDNFKKSFRNAGLIISKGQGNFESLTQVKGIIFYLFMVKCNTVANHLGCNIRDIILLKSLAGKIKK
ncbi:MAG: DUF89 family protein [Endomicrobiales bacterium]|nr:DUF89 family protein [Endomicrobiales bacterium]